MKNLTNIVYLVTIILVVLIPFFALVDSASNFNGDDSDQENSVSYEMSYEDEV